MAEGTSYRFEPLERRGLLLGLGGGQLAVIAVGLLGAVAMAGSWPGVPGLAGATLALVAAVALCRPVGGRPPVQWVTSAVAFAGRRRRVLRRPPGHAHEPAPLPADTAATAAAPRPGRHGNAITLPAKTFVAGVHLHELPQSAADVPLGVLIDQRQGTASAVMRVRGGAFCLVDGTEKDARLAGWAAVLESLASRRNSLARLQWCQRALPSDSEDLLAHLRRWGDPARPGFAGHAALLKQAGARGWRHETLVVVSVHCRSARGRPHLEDAASLRNEMRSLRAQMRGVGLVCEGALSGWALARALGDFLVPGLAFAPGSYPWPLAFDERWSEVRAEDLWHRAYWVAEWPRSRVGPDFLSPLLMGTGRRSFSVVMSPLPPEKAMRDAESSRTAQMADSHLRAQGGFLETAKHRRQAEAVEDREVQLADGRSAFQLSGYIAVSAPDKAGLESACADLEHSAASAHLVVRPLHGQQKDALFWTLPMGRGL